MSQLKLLGLKSDENLKRKSSLEIIIKSKFIKEYPSPDVNIVRLDFSQPIKHVSALSYWWYTDYASDIYGALREREQRRQKFRYQSPQASHREDLVNFMRKVAEKEQLSRTTVHLGVYILDMFMDNHKITIERLNLVTMVSMLLASKMEDREPKIPKISDLNESINNQYPLSDFISLELMILIFMEWDMLIPTAATFVEYFVAEVVTQIDFEANKSELTYNDFKSTAIYLVLEYLDLTLLDCQMMQARPSKIAAACLLAARKTLNIEPNWTIHLTELTKYQRSDIEWSSMTLITAKLENGKQAKPSKINSSLDSGFISETDLSRNDCSEDYIESTSDTEESDVETPAEQKLDNMVYYDNVHVERNLLLNRQLQIAEN